MFIVSRWSILLAVSDSAPEMIQCVTNNLQISSVSSEAALNTLGESRYLISHSRKMTWVLPELVVFRIGPLHTEIYIITMLYNISYATGIP